jgi:hypothetical protein
MAYSGYNRGLTTTHKIKWILVTCAAFFLMIMLRIPFLQQPLIGEEGMFAMIVSGYQSPLIKGADDLPSQIDRHCLLVLGHIDQTGDALTRPGRNIVPYCFLGFVIKSLIAPLNTATLDFDAKSGLIRSVFLGLSSVGFLSLCFLSYLVSLRLSGFKATLPFLVLFYFTTTHLAIGSSIQPQLDGVFGFLLLSNAALLVYFGSRLSTPTWSKLPLNFLAGFLVALCKNEWPLTLLVSVILVYCLMFVHRAILSYRGISVDENQKSANLLIGIGLILGCLSGMGFCYLFSPNDYLAGFGLMKNIHSSRGSHLKIFFQTLRFNYQILTPSILMLIFGLWCVWKNWKSLLNQEIGLLILYVLSFGILAGFMQSGWGGDGFPRYYLPPLLLSGIFLITQIPSVLPQSAKPRVVKSFAMIFGFAIIFNYGSLLMKFERGESLTVPGNYVDVKNTLIGAAAINKKDPYGVMVHQVGIGFYFPGTNFIALDIGREEALKWPLPSPKYYLVM